jgi:hypothetical protein
LQRTIDRRRTHRQQRGTDIAGQLKVAMPFHRLNQDRHERPQPFATNSIRRLPDHDQRRAHRVVVLKRSIPTLPTINPLGSKSGEATTHHAGTFLVRQCGSVLVVGPLPQTHPRSSAQ